MSKEDLSGAKERVKGGPTGAKGPYVRALQSDTLCRHAVKCHCCRKQ